MPTRPSTDSGFCPSAPSPARPAERLLLRLLFPSDSGMKGQVTVAVQVPGSGPLPAHLHDAGLDQLQAREEPADLSVRARRDRHSGLLVAVKRDILARWLVAARHLPRPPRPIPSWECFRQRARASGR